ncbi:hypothetical protein HAX54_052111, partial [Datura stramonium]|nr:hypothetical protein [Datura stramonium]
MVVPPGDLENVFANVNKEVNYESISTNSIHTWQDLKSGLQEMVSLAKRWSNGDSQ